MKVLVVGDWLVDIYEEAIYKGFQRHDCDVDKFSWIQYFKYYQYSNIFKEFDVKGGYFTSRYYRLQNQFRCGPVLLRINKDLVKMSALNNYDLIFIYRGTHIFPSTIKTLKKTGALVFGYNNDDPFSSQYPSYFWKHYLKSARIYDHIFSYREKNIEQYKSIGVQNSTLLRSYYLNDKNYVIQQSEISGRYKTDVIFAGHYENDGRDELILHLLNAGINLKVYGYFWENSKLYDDIKKYCGDIVRLSDDYNEAINGAKLALVFLSKKNNDTYTRRVFEIPACHTVMLSEYTDDIASMFKEGSEILFFRDKHDCLKKVVEVIGEPEILDKIARNAMVRLEKDGHEVFDRISQIIEQYKYMAISK